MEKIRGSIYLDKNIKGLPFKVEISNKETMQAIEETEKGINLEEVTFEQLKQEAKERIIVRTKTE